MTDYRNDLRSLTDKELSERVSLYQRIRLRLLLRQDKQQLVKVEAGIERVMNEQARRRQATRQSR